MTEASFLRTTRTAYDTMATDYAARSHDELAGQPLERGIFAAFAELVRATGPVADVGCGPGRTAGHLHGLGVDVFGVDLSPEMLALARRDHPDVRFEEGSMTALDVPDGALGGIVANYSIIHIPTEQLPGVFAEFHRVLAPGGHLLITVLNGDEHLHRTEAFGHTIALDYYLRPPDQIAGLLAEAGLVTKARLLREPEETEMLPRAFLFARKARGAQP